MSVDAGKGVAANGEERIATVRIVTDAGNIEKEVGDSHVQQRGTSGHEVVEGIGGVGYFEGDQDFHALELQWVLPPQPTELLPSKWLSVMKTENAFASLTSGLLMSTIPAQIAMPSAPHLLAGTRTIDGQTVKGLQASAMSRICQSDGHSVCSGNGFTVACCGGYCDQSKSRDYATFSGWNEPVDMTTPSSSIPFSSTGQ